jgi:hypothetical protein
MDPIIVNIQSIQSHKPPHYLSLNSSAEAIPILDKHKQYIELDNNPIIIPPNKCFHLLDYFKKLIIKNVFCLSKIIYDTILSYTHNALQDIF